MSEKHEDTKDAKPPQIRVMKIEKGAAEPILMKLVRFTRPIDIPFSDVAEGLKGSDSIELKNSPQFRITFLPWLRKYHIACYGPAKTEPVIRHVHESHVLMDEPY